MKTVMKDQADALTKAAIAAADAIAPYPAFSLQRERLLRLPRRLTRFGDLLCEALEDLVDELVPTDGKAAARLSSLLLDALLAEEGFSRPYWKAFRRHLRLLSAAGRGGEKERCLRETLELAAAFE